VFSQIKGENFARIEKTAIQKFQKDFWKKILNQIEYLSKPHNLKCALNMMNFGLAANLYQLSHYGSHFPSTRGR
jgi:hypothetical protein